MYHSINIITNRRDYIGAQGLATTKPINTYSDWHLVPSSRPTIVNPKLISNYIDIPGASGSLDMTEALTGFPLYSDREGDLEFYVLNDYGSWTTRRNEINNILHGQKVSIYLEDEQDYYYVGRMEVNDWKSQKDFSMITFHYRLEPFKYKVQDVNGNWEWDPFNFETGVIFDSYNNLKGNESDGTAKVRYNYAADMLPKQPTYAIFTISNVTSESPLNIKFLNGELRINETLSFTSSGTYILYDWLFSNISGKNLVSIYVSGTTGKADISMHFRSL